MTFPNGDVFEGTYVKSMIPDPVAVAEAEAAAAEKAAAEAEAAAAAADAPEGEAPAEGDAPAEAEAPEPEIPLIPTSMRQGKGRYVFKPTREGEGEELSGGFYEGEFVDNKKHGAGEDAMAASSAPRGDQMHGEGEYTYVSGDVYRGVFEKGKKHGRASTSSRRASRRSWGDGRRGVRGGRGLLRRLLLPRSVRRRQADGRGHVHVEREREHADRRVGSGRRVHRRGHQGGGRRLMMMLSKATRRRGGFLFSH